MSISVRNAFSHISEWSPTGGDGVFCINAYEDGECLIYEENSDSFLTKKFDTHEEAMAMWELLQGLESVRVSVLETLGFVASWKRSTKEIA